MAILRLSTGEVYSEYSDINPLVTPVQVGSFSLSKSVKEKVHAMAMPMTQEDVGYVLNNLDSLEPNVETMMKEAGYDFAYRRIGCYVPPKERGGMCSFQMLESEKDDPAVFEMSEATLAKQNLPHNSHYNDWHFMYSGVVMKGIQMEGNLQAVLYVEGGEWLRFSSTVLNWTIFAFGAPIIGVSYYDREPNADGGFDLDLHPDHKVQEIVKY